MNMYFNAKLALSAIASNKLHCGKQRSRTIVKVTKLKLKTVYYVHLIIQYTYGNTTVEY